MDTPRPRRDLRVSVRVRILAAILAVAALGMVAVGTAAALVQRDAVLRDIDERLQTAIDSVRTTIETAAENDPALTPEVAVQSAISRVLPERNESTVGVQDGVVRWVPGTAMSFDLGRDPELIARAITESAGGDIVVGTAESAVFGLLRYAVVPVMSEGPDVSDALFVTAFDLDAELRIVEATTRTFIIASAIALAVTALVGWFVAGRLLLPLRQLRGAASRITAQDLSERIPVRGSDDVSALTETVNGMLERLERSATARRRLLADVRHELATPITIVRGHVELMDPDERDEFETAKGIAIEELDRMAGLVNDIESLALVEAGVPLVLCPTDIADLTDQVFARATQLSHHEWRLGALAVRVAVIDRDKIVQAWLQLAANAAKYSPEGTTIVISSAADEAANVVRLSVRDEGPGIPVEEQQRIFERFTRGDGVGRARGSGLGLAIVNSIATAHGGRVDLVSDEGGSEFTIVVPLAPLVPVEGESR